MMKKTFNLAALGLVALVLSCGKPSEPPSNIGISNDEGKAGLAERLAKTGEINGHINQLRDAIQPASVMLSDLADAVRTEETTDSVPSEKIQNILDVVQKVLKEVTQGLVQYNPDGSWVIEKPLKFPNLLPEYVCPTAKIRLHGQREENVEALRLQVIGCGHTVGPIELAYIGIDPKKNVLASLHLQNASSLFSKEGLVGDSCKVSTKGSAFEVSCKPLLIKVKDVHINVSQLFLQNDTKGITAQIAVAVRRISNAKLILSASLVATPGQKTKISINTKGD